MTPITSGAPAQPAKISPTLPSAAGVAPARTGAVAPSPARQDSLTLSPAAQAPTAAKPPIAHPPSRRPRAHLDLKQGAHASISGFGQQVTLGIDRDGLRQDAKIMGIKEHLGGDLSGLDANLNIGHSEAKVGLGGQGASATIDTLGLNLTGKATGDGLDGDAALSKNGLVVPLSFTGSEVVLAPDGNLNAHVSGVDAGINLLNGQGAHAGVSHLGVGVKVSADEGGTVDAHVGSHHVSKSR